ncbi:MAG TPA: hypothetical protein VLE27_14620 [Thermoanaerobaculia bacterium]|nr:hypothetical protein [Thermoanaerobaculia bacterium]
MRSAPRLPSQQPLRIDFLITRVPSGSTRSTEVIRLLQPLGDSVAVLPHDSAIASQERVLAGWEPARPDWRGERAAGTELLSATLDWIAKAFPGHKEAAEAARRRIRTGTP